MSILMLIVLAFFELFALILAGSAPMGTLVIHIGVCLYSIMYLIRKKHSDVMLFKIVQARMLTVTLACLVSFLFCVSYISTAIMDGYYLSAILDGIVALFAFGSFVWGVITCISTLNNIYNGKQYTKMENDRQKVLDARADRARKVKYQNQENDIKDVQHEKRLKEERAAAGITDEDIVKNKRQKAIAGVMDAAHKGGKAGARAGAYAAGAVTGIKTGVRAGASEAAAMEATVIEGTARTIEDSNIPSADKSRLNNEIQSNTEGIMQTTKAATAAAMTAVRDKLQNFGVDTTNKTDDEVADIALSYAAQTQLDDLPEGLTKQEQAMMVLGVNPA